MAGLMTVLLKAVYRFQDISLSPMSINLESLDICVPFTTSTAVSELVRATGEGDFQGV